MTRRAGVIAALATVAGAMQQDYSTTSTAKLISPLVRPSRLQVNLGDGGFDEIHVVMGKRKVILTADEIMDALEAK